MSAFAFDLKDFRQPVVTSLGVILGFLVSFLGQWVTEENFALRTTADWTVITTSIGGGMLLFVALFRMLQPAVPGEAALAHYRCTLRFYMAGLTVSFGGLLASAVV